jgi:hypothetical protein
MHIGATEGLVEGDSAGLAFRMLVGATKGMSEGVSSVSKRKSSLSFTQISRLRDSYFVNSYCSRLKIMLPLIKEDNVEMFYVL